jgi:hypothetical protein
MYRGQSRGEKKGKSRGDNRCDNKGESRSNNRSTAAAELYASEELEEQHNYRKTLMLSASRACQSNVLNTEATFTFLSRLVREVAHSFHEATVFPCISLASIYLSHPLSTLKSSVLRRGSSSAHRDGRRLRLLSLAVFIPSGLPQLRRTNLL